MQYCYFCGRQAEAKHHLIFGISQRALAEEDKLCVFCCSSCHNMGKVTERIHDNVMAEKLSKMLGQAIYESKKLSDGKTQEEARREFMARYGRSYL